MKYVEINACFLLQNGQLGYSASIPVKSVYRGTSWLVSEIVLLTEEDKM